MAIDAEQRAALLAAKARALVAGAGADLSSAELSPLPGAVAVRTSGTAWFLLDQDPPSWLGRCLVWADRHGADSIRLLADDVDAASTLARRASHFALDVTVLVVDGRDLHPVAPASVPRFPEPAADALALGSVILDAGADVVVEHGAVIGEVEGLEVARVVHGPDGPRLEVGVGRHDREAFAMVHGDRPAAEALAEVVATVRRHRRPDQPGHPLNRLARERWMRRRVLEEPALVGAGHLEPAEPTLPRGSVKDVAPAVAVGQRSDGTDVVVATSVGIDLDLVPAGADARAAHLPGADLVLAVPARDVHPVTRRLAADLHQPATVVPLDVER